LGGHAANAARHDAVGHAAGSRVADRGRDAATPQQFRPAPGRLVHWTATRVSDAALLQSDSVFTDSVGLVTIPSVKTYRFGTRLELTGPPPNTGAPPDARPELRLGPLANPVGVRAVIAGSWAHDGPARVELFDASGRIARAIWRGAARAGAW